MKKLNRKFVRFSQTLLMIGCFSYTITYLFMRGSVLMRLSSYTQIVALLLWFAFNRCPHCKKWQPILNGSAPDAGTCPGCGKVMEYKN